MKNNKGILTKVTKQIKNSKAMTAGSTIAGGCGAITVSWLLFGALSLPLALPIALGGGLLGGAAYTSYNYMRNNSESEKKEKAIDKALANIKRALDPAKNSNNNIIKINFADEKFLSKVSKLVKKSAPDQKNHVISKLIIDCKLITEGQLKKLLAAGLGELKIQQLEIINTNLGYPLVDMLQSSVADGGFKHLTTLVVSNNMLDARALPKLADIGKSLSLEHLDVSKNRLNYTVATPEQQPMFDGFFDNFFKSFPRLKHLNLSKTGLSVESMKPLKQLFVRPSMLTTLVISKNFALKDMAAFLKSPEVQSNLNIAEIDTGKNYHKWIRSTLDKHNQLIEKARKVLGVGSDMNVAMVLFEKATKPGFKIPKDLTGFFNMQAVSEEGHKESVRQKWDLLVSKFKKFMANVPAGVDINAGDDFTEKHIVFTEHESSDASFKLTTHFTKIENCAANQKVNLEINSDDSGFKLENSDGIPAVNGLLEKLGHRAQKPIIKRLTLCELGLSSEQFSNLLVNGLGDYRTQVLNLSRNELTDDAMIDLADSDEDVFSRVKELDLSHNRLSCGALNAIATFAARAGVECLNLSGNQLKPRSNLDRQLLKGFIDNLHTKIPTLKKLNISHVGLENAHVEILKPLLCEVSLLEEINISQQSVTRQHEYQKLLSSKAFLNNVTVPKVETEKGRMRRIHQRLKQQNILRDALASEFDDVEDRSSILGMLVQRFLDHKQPEFSDVVGNALKKSKQFSLGYQFTYQEYLELAAKEIQFFRDKALVADKELHFPDLIQDDEIVAWEQRKLKEYWLEKIKAKPMTNARNLAALKQKHSDIQNGESSIRMIELGNFNVGAAGNQIGFKLFYGLDNTIRLIDLTNRNTYVISRLGVAWDCAPQSAKVVNIGGLSIIINDQGTVQIKVNDNLYAKIDGHTISTSANGALSTANVDISNLQVASTLQAFVQALNPRAEEQRRPDAATNLATEQNPYPVLHRFAGTGGQQRSGAQRAVPHCDNPQETANVRRPGVQVS